MRKWLLFAFVTAGVFTFGYFDWQDTLPDDVTYIHIGDPILHHTWTCEDGATGCTSTTSRTCTGTSCVITVGSTTAGSVEIVCGQPATTSITFTVSGDGTWVSPAASQGTDSTAGRVACAYNLNATGGGTAITCTFSTGNAANQCKYMRFTFTQSTVTFDVANNIDDSANCTTCTGVALSTTTANNYLLIQSSSCGGTCTGINQSYTVGGLINGDGMAYKINVSSAGTTPSWTQTSSAHLAGSGLAIYESSGGGAVAGFNKRAKLIKLGVD